MSRRALAFAVIALAACRPQATALRVEVDADPALARYVQMVRVRVFAPPTAAQPLEQHDVVVGVGAVRWPLAFNITADGADARVRVDVDGFREPSQDPDAAGLVRARAITSFREGKVLLLPLVFWSACRGTEALDCGLTETCSREGRCVSADVPAASLDEYTPAGGDSGPVCEAGARALGGVCVAEAADAAPDATPDAAPDVAPDATPDAAPDLPMDVAPDAAPDAGPEVTIEPAPDAAPDVSMDATVDIAPDAAPDLTPDLTPDAAPDAAPDIAPDAAPDIAPDIAPDVPSGPTVDLVSPPHGAVLSGPTPNLRWAQPPGAPRAFIEVCGDRACASVQYTFADAAGSNTHRVGTRLAQGRHWWRVSATSAAGPWSAPRAFEVRGNGVASAALGTAPDFTNDGVHDLVTGLPGFFGGGQVWLYPGRAAGFDPASPTLVTSAAGVFYGERLAAVGDMNGDGTLDLAVSSPPLGVDGSVHVLGGSDVGLAGMPAFRLEPSSGGSASAFGEAFASVGDLDGDGLTDVVVGAPQYNSGEGRVWIFRGVRAGLTPTPAALDSPGNTGGRFGNFVTGLGDFNGDGLGDFAVTAPDRFGGTVYVYLGTAGAAPRLAFTFEPPPSSGTAFGARLAGGVDLDGDGLGDLAVGAATAVPFGAVYVYFGATGARTSVFDEVLLPPGAGESLFGMAVTSGGDMDGDGLDDLIIAQGGRDHVHVYAGAPRGGSHRVIATVQRPADGAAYFSTGYGKALAGLDLNHDGRRDLLIGAYNEASGAGRIYAHVQIATGGVPAAPTFVINGAAGARLGSSIAQ
ncbi:MAG: FG-GAP-like repeat-containing protein [Polyangiales bacterium]